MNAIYLDNAASTPLSAEVLDAMTDACRRFPGNPSSAHRSGRSSRHALQDARSRLADLIQCEPDEIVFTSGGTEADNLAVKGVVAAAKGAKRVVSSSTEHRAVQESLSAVEQQGVDIALLSPDANGIISPADVRSAVTDDTVLVSVIAVNNETGVINDVSAMASELAGSKAVLHADAVQMLGKIPVTCADTGADLLSFSAHKIHGPRGVGALYVRHGTLLKSIISGGNQESGRRAGTENLSGIIGFVKAVEVSVATLAAGRSHVSALRDRLLERLQPIGGMFVNGDLNQMSPYVVNVAFESVDGAMLHKMLADRGVCVSAGSACNADSQQPSHVLTAMGLDASLAAGSVRFSFSSLNDMDEVDMATKHCCEVVSILRGS